MSDQDVLLIDDLARLLRVSRRTIEKRLATPQLRHLLPPEMPRIDSKHRWSRAVAKDFIDKGHLDLRHLRKVG